MEARSYCFAADRKRDGNLKAYRPLQRSTFPDLNPYPFADKPKPSALKAITPVPRNKTHPRLFAVIQDRGQSLIGCRNATRQVRGSAGVRRPSPPARKQRFKSQEPNAPPTQHSRQLACISGPENKTERANKPARQAPQARKRPRLFAIIQDRSPKSTRLRHSGRQVRGPAIALRSSRRSRKQPAQTPELKPFATPHIRVYWRAFADRKTKRNAPVRQVPQT